MSVVAVPYRSFLNSFPFSLPGAVKLPRAGFLAPMPVLLSDRAITPYQKEPVLILLKITISPLSNVCNVSVGIIFVMCGFLLYCWVTLQRFTLSRMCQIGKPPWKECKKWLCISANKITEELSKTHHRKLLGGAWREWEFCLEVNTHAVTLICCEGSARIIPCAWNLHQLFALL